MNRPAAGDTHGERVPRKGTVMNVQAMKPWLVRIYQALADGAWHDRESLVSAGAAVVPPGQAYRHALRKTGPGPDPDRDPAPDPAPERKVARGQRDMASQALLSAVRFCGVERDGDQFRMTNRARAAWAAQHPGPDAVPPCDPVR